MKHLFYCTLIFNSGQLNSSQLKGNKVITTILMKICDALEILIEYRLTMINPVFQFQLQSV